MLHCIAQICSGISEVNVNKNSQRNHPLVPGGSQVDLTTFAISAFIPSKGKKRKVILGGISQAKLFSAQLIQSST